MWCDEGGDFDFIGFCCSIVWIGGFLCVDDVVEVRVDEGKGKGVWNDVDKGC